jgi:tricorn protease
MLRWMILCMVLPISAEAAGSAGYYRFPALHDTTLVFTAEGDLWVVGIHGGTAKRITSHLGQETNAAISPDGATLAFSGQYEGPTEVYVMPLTGGVPRRLTFDDGAVVVGWTPDGRVLYRTGRYSTLPNAQLAAVDLQSGRSERIPLWQASDGSFGDDTTLYFTRLPFQGSHTKRYKGGTAQKIWKFNPRGGEARPLTADYDGTSKTPLFYQGRIYFASDRDGTMNLWSMNPDGKDLKQLTFHKGWDVKSPALGGGKIAYQLGADLFCYDIATGSDGLIPLTLSSDFDQLRGKWVKDPLEYMTRMAISPTGDRVVLTVRGQVYVAPAVQGRFVRVTENDRIRYRNATFMPDGKSLLALSDETGETEFVRLPANGVGRSEPLTHDAKVLRFAGIPSPDGKWVAYTDKNEELWMIDVERKTDTRILKTDEGGIGELSWSPDSRWLAFSKTAPNFFNQISLYHLSDGKFLDLTTDRVDSYAPVWSPDGKWIYYLSDRVFHSVVPSPWGAHQPEPFFDKTRNVYAVALRGGLRFPFLPDDELHAPQEAPKAAEAKEEKKKEAKPVEVEIEPEGLRERTYQVPLPTGAYTDLSVNEKFLFLSEKRSFYDPKTNLVALEIKNRDVAAKTLVEEIRGFDLSADGKKLLVRKAKDLYVIDATATPPSDLAKSKLDLSGWMLTVDPKEEFRLMFVEAWRLERDYFYDPAMHGVDYRGLLEKHLPLVERVTDREELSDLISDLVGELSALHTFVFGGDIRRPSEEIVQGSLGALLTRDEKAGGYRIDHLYRGEPEDLEVLSPLAGPGLGVEEGDLLLAINGTPLAGGPSPGALLENQVGKQVLLHIRSGGSGKEKDVVVVPITSDQESNLRYSEWERTRRLEVDSLGKGELGYVHLRAMGGSNYAEWVKAFYPVFDRKGLIVDVRHNRGGNIDSWILEKLLRRAWFYWEGRVGKPYWNMQFAFRGHMVVLCDERTASDGEAFTEGFRRLGLGKVIGTRTWGGEIWLSMGNLLVDKGIASAAETGVFGPEGEWLIEGRGVEPDIVVDNLPHATFQGKDAQLEAAVHYLQEQIRLHPIEVPKVPPRPNKAFHY